MDPLTPADIERLKVLHGALDELMACFLARTERLPSSTTLTELLQWSHQQIDPSAPKLPVPNEVARLQEKWRDYENNYILPCFRWAAEMGFDLQEAVLRNPGKNCVELLVERLRRHAALDAPPANPLAWIRRVGEGGNTYSEATVGDFAGGDGVRFTLEYRATNYRRGQWWLLVEVAGGPGKEKWGCLDFQDQPERYYHDEVCARREAQALADVLRADRAKKGAIDG